MDPLSIRFTIHPPTVQNLPPSTRHPKKTFRPQRTTRSLTAASRDMYPVPIPVRRPVRRKKRWYQ